MTTSPARTGALAPRANAALAAVATLSLTLAAACGADAPAALDASTSADTTAKACSVAADCAAPSAPCKVATCTAAGQCIEAAASDGSPCEDPDPCVSGGTCSAGSCGGGSYTCACQVDGDCADDGDLCNGTMICDTSGAAPACVAKPGSAITCDDSLDTACSKATCDAKTGACAAQPVADGGACDDGNTCTADDACKAGVCAGTSTCACEADVDCAKVEDGDLCNGMLYCDKSSHTCQVNPATVVQCATSGNTACQAWQCQPKEGKCAFGPKPNGAACDVDWSACSLDSCVDGGCQPGPIDAKCACQGDADCKPFEDGNLCNGTLFCNKATATCELNPATMIWCPSVFDTACAKNQCQPSSGACAMTPSVDGSACDDGWTCSSDETCQGGVCTPKAGQCQCQTTADCAAYEATNACAKLYCDKPAGVCKVNPATIKQCNELGDPACSETVCDKTSGACEIKPIHDGGPCEADGSWCTSLDVCKDGACVAAKNKCPCKADADCKAAEDGNACNGTLYCDKPSGACVVNPATVPTCAGDGEGPCKPLQCDNKDGACKALPLPDGVTCDSDGFVCTAEHCAAGACKLVSKSCLCWEDADCLPFDDGNACNGKLYCDKLAGPPSCTLNPASVVTCIGSGSGAPCTSFGCEAKDGSCKDLPLPNGATCTDSNACTTSDACAAGACIGSIINVKNDCNDGNTCTADACDKAKGCTHAAASAAACEDGDLCSEGDKCTATGTCQGGMTLPCVGGTVCAPSVCVKGACETQQAPQGTPCDDGNKCTGPDTCGAQGCVGAPTAGPCNDGSSCTTDSCDPKVGCVHTNVSGKCDDGNPCTDDDSCDAGTCKGFAKDCDDGDGCTADGCDPKVGCTHTSNVGALCPGGVCGASGCAVSSTGPQGAGNGVAAYYIVYDKVIGWGRKVKGLLPAAAKTGEGPHGPTALDVPGIVAIASDDTRACGLHADGTLTCWGTTGGDVVFAPILVVAPVKIARIAGRYGQLLLVDVQGGLWAMDDSSKATSIKKLTDAPEGKPYTDVAPGDSHGCAIQQGGKVRCWGNAPDLVLGPNGPGDGAQATAAVEVPLGSEATVEVCAGLSFTCARAAGGTVRCWGVGGDGQLGDGKAKDSQTPVIVAGTDGGGANTPAATLRCGDEHACIGLKDGKVLCWGRNDRGQLGAGDTAHHPAPTPVLGAAGGPALSLAGGDLWALPAGGCVAGGATAWCWGDAAGGAMVNWASGTASDAFVPAPVVKADGSKFTGASQLFGSEGAVCARTGVSKPFTWYCWGTNRGGVTGLKGAWDQAIQVATPVPMLSSFDYVWVTPEEGCGLNVATKKLSCWGSNVRPGQVPASGATLGVNSGLAVAEPVEVQLPAGGLAAGVAVVRTRNHACVNTDQGLACWGFGGGGQIGLATKPALQAPVALSINDGVTRIAASPDHTCILNGMAVALCWGRNLLGQVGIGTASPTVNTPTFVKDVFGLATIEVGAASSVAVDTDGVVWAWGYHGKEQNVLGHEDNNVMTSTVPVKVDGFGLAPKIKAKDAVIGATGGCALDTSFKVRCWGNNERGTLGQGHANQVPLASQPIAPVGVPNLTAMRAHADAYCGRSISSEVWCWGSRDSPVVGRGTHFRSVPTKLTLPFGKT